MSTWIDLKCPVPAITLQPSGTHWTQGASPNQLKAPMIAKRKNEGLPLTGDKLCYSNKVEKSWSLIIPGKTFWIGVGEARAELTEMALGRETCELNATTAC